MEYSATHIRYMQKTLMEMNVHLHHVVSGITSATGMRIISAIILYAVLGVDLTQIHGLGSSLCHKLV